MVFMRRTSFADMRCSIARSLELIGEWWTLLIIREAFFGSQHFGEFEAHLGIAPNVLSQRLTRLVEGGIFEVTSTSQSGKALAYKLTEKGRDLMPVIVALTQWGDKHEPAPEGPPVRIIERRNGEPITYMQPRSSVTGRALGKHEVTVVAGPGATAEDKARLDAIAERVKQRRQAAK
jgi:DNA-binding HxlR family transcriptional regulator